MIVKKLFSHQDKSAYRKVVGTTQENLFVIKELDEEKLKADLEQVKAKGNRTDLKGGG